MVKGTVTEVDAKGAKVKLADEVEGYLRASEIQQDKVEDASTVLNVGDEVEAKIVNVDRKTRGISLSVKAKDEAEQRDAIKALSANTAQEVQPKTIGDLIKEQQNNQ